MGKGGPGRTVTSTSQCDKILKAGEGPGVKQSLSWGKKLKAHRSYLENSVLIHTE